MLVKIAVMLKISPPCWTEVRHVKHVKVFQKQITRIPQDLTDNLRSGRNLILLPALLASIRTSF